MSCLMAVEYRCPGWRDLQFTRIPRRLRDKVPGAAGSNSTACFKLGSGAFQRTPVTDALELIPDSGEEPVTHGVVVPIEIVPLTQYQADLENTREDWEIDET